MNLRFAPLLVVLLYFEVCTSSGQVPIIESFTPTSAPIGSSVTISGANFGLTPSNNIVYFGAVRATVTAADTNLLTVSVPAGATYQPITVTVAGLTAASGRYFLPAFRGGPQFRLDPGIEVGTATQYPATVGVGDLDGDGKPDAVTMGSVVFNFGSGTGNFPGLGLFRNAGSANSPLAFDPMFPLYPHFADYVNQNGSGQLIADLDGDGKLDLVAASYAGVLRIYRNIASPGVLNESSFADAIELPINTTPFSLAVGDLDGDGRPDLIIGGGELIILRNLTIPGIINSNSFAEVLHRGDVAAPLVAVADFDMDGSLDLVTGSGSGLKFMRNKGAATPLSGATFEEPIAISLSPPDLVTLAVGDLNGDGRPDIVALRGYPSPFTVVVLRNLTTAPGLTTNSFAIEAQISGPSPPGGGAVAIGDLNGDGKVDLAVLFRNNISYSLSVFLHVGTSSTLDAGSFAPPAQLFFGGDYHPLALALADVDGDARPDVVMATYRSTGNTPPNGSLTIYHNSTPPPPNQPPTVNIISPTNGSIFITPVDVSISAEATDSDGTVTQVVFRAGSDVIGVASSPFSMTWSNVLAGSYTLTATAFDDSGNSTTSAGININVNGPPVPPSITTPPQSQSVTLGSNATFTITASGTAPLSYLWFFNGTNSLGVTSSTLALTNVQFSQAGDYSVVVTNVAGSITSAPAHLTVIPPGGRLIQARNATGAPGETVQEPIMLVGQGNENAIGFSLVYPNSLSYVTAELGAGASDAILNLNPAQAGSGRLGVSLALSAGASFAAGTQELVIVTFAIASEIGNTTAAISFGDQPLAREISDALANSLPALFAGSTVVISGGGYEADVSPAPDGNGAVTVTDWVKVGRYAAGLDTVSSASQFQRADCAPRSSLGNGSVTITDWVQAGRYAAGLDPLTAAGGPTGPGASAPARFAPAQFAVATSVREIRASNTPIYPGQTNRVSVVLVSQGDESAVGFTLNFNPKIATLLGATAGSNAGGAVFNVNSSQAAVGRVGIALSLPIGSAFPRGTQEIAAIRFVIPQSATDSNSLQFGDTPVRREVSDVLANSVVAVYTSGSMQVVPSLHIAKNGANDLLSWPLWAANFVIESSDVLGQGAVWAAPPATGTNTTASEIQVTTPPNTNQRFFRLRLP